MKSTYEKGIAVIPVKGYSSRIPRKNFFLFGKKAMWELSVDAALESPEIDTILITTDRVTDVVNFLGARGRVLVVEKQKDFTIVEYFDFPDKVIWVLSRPTELALDPVQVDEVALHALRQYSVLSPRLTRNIPIVILQPTSPLRTSQNITEAMNLFQMVKETATKSPLPVVVGCHPGGFAYAGPINGEYVSIKHNPQHRLGQEYAEYNRVAVENGAIYITDWGRFSDERSFRSQHIVPYFMSFEESLDVDTPEQMLIARALFNRREKEGG